MLPALPPLGVGAVYWDILHPLFAAHPDLFQVAEIEPSTFWIKAPGADGPVRSNPFALERIAGLPQAKLIHGVGYPVGGRVCDQDAHLAEQRRWAARLEAPWTSEHLSFNETEDGAAGFLLPPCQSEDGVAVAAANIRRRASLLGRPFAFETGVNYLAPRPGEMDDGAFFAAVAEAADCHILLDLHNLWANARNGRTPVLDVVAALPLQRVCEVHLAGGFEKDGYWLDAHSDLVPPGLLDLAAEIMPQLPRVKAILFEIAPQHAARIAPADLVRQVEALHPLWERIDRQESAEWVGPIRIASPDEPSASKWEQGLVRSLAGPARDGEDSAIPLYRSLIASFRGGALADLLPHSLRLVQLSRGEPALDALLADYVRATAPLLYPADEALQFADWLGANMPAIPYLDDILALEAGIVRFASLGRGGEIRFAHDPSLIVAAVAEGRRPADLAATEYRVVIGAD